MYPFDPIKKIVLCLILLSSCGVETRPARLQTIVDNSPIERPLPKKLLHQSNDNEHVALSKVAQSVGTISLSNGWFCSGFLIKRDADYAYIATARFCDARLYTTLNTLTATVALGPRLGAGNTAVNTLNNCTFINFNPTIHTLNRFNFTILACPRQQWQSTRLPAVLPFVSHTASALQGRIGWDNMNCKDNTLCPPWATGTHSANSASVLIGFDGRHLHPSKRSLFISRRWPVENRQAPAKTLFKGDSCRTYWRQSRYLTEQVWFGNNLKTLRYPPKKGRFHAFSSFCSTPGHGASGGIALMNFNGTYQVFALIAGESLAIDTPVDNAYDHNILAAIPAWATKFSTSNDE